MADNKRRLAADARRVAEKSAQSREAVADLRRLMRTNYDRGKEDGRAEVLAENSGVDLRATVLSMQADDLDLSVGALAAVPNSQRAISALREAVSILRDAVRAGEPPAEEPKAKTEPKKGKKSG